MLLLVLSLLLADSALLTGYNIAHLMHDRRARRAHAHANSHRVIVDAAGAFCADCGKELTDEDGHRLSPVPECSTNDVDQDTSRPQA